MTKRTIAKWWIWGLALLAALFTGCLANVVIGSGRVTTENRTVSNFDGISLSGIGDVTITQGDTEALTVEAEDNLMPYLKTEVRNGTLAIFVDNGNGRTAVSPTKPVRFNLSVKNLNSIDLSGAGGVKSASLKSDHLTIRISGAGSVNLDHLAATDVTSTLTGAGNVKVVGQVTSQAAVLSGIGGYVAGDLSSQTARIDITGAGSASVWVRDSLDITISGAGSVNYYGSPRLRQTISGVGSITHLGNK
jgi:putative autotransporter adhesin-like protein